MGKGEGLKVRLPGRSANLCGRRDAGGIDGLVFFHQAAEFPRRDATDFAEIPDKRVNNRQTRFGGDSFDLVIGVEEEIDGEGDAERGQQAFGRDSDFFLEEVS